MRRRPASLGLTLWLTAMLLLLFVPAANAYVDSGSVAVMFQAIVAGLAAAGMFVRVFWRRIRNFFSRSSTGAAEDIAASAPAEDAAAVPAEDAAAVPAEGAAAVPAEGAAAVPADDHVGDASR